MAEFFLELFLESVFSGAFMSSNMTSSKKIKIWHAIFRSCLYLLITGLFFFLAVFASTTTIERVFYSIVGLIFFSVMLKTNWTSYKRHHEWIVLKQELDRRRTSTIDKPF
jgi:hypothetical protein